eukprot:5390889-Amphidinium_carterae.1
MRSHGSFEKVSPRDGGNNVLKPSLRGRRHRTIRGSQIAYSLRAQNALASPEPTAGSKASWGGPTLLRTLLLD